MVFVVVIVVVVVVMRLGWGGSPLFFYTPLCCHRLWLSASRKGVVFVVVIVMVLCRSGVRTGDRSGVRSGGRLMRVGWGGPPVFPTPPFVVSVR